MGKAKDIVLRPITARQANDAIRRIHYSGKVAPNSQLHIGVYYKGFLEGAMQFGPPLCKRNVIGLVKDTVWNGMIELNRMAFSDRLPPMSESRALGVAMRLLRKNRPDIEWVLSFADATQCGDGTIYRASGFVLTDIKESKGLLRFKDGSVIHWVTMSAHPCQPIAALGGRCFKDVTGGKASMTAFVKATGAEALPGYQLRYIYFLNPAARARLTVPEVPFSEIAARGATMYLGQTPAGAPERGPGFRPGNGGATPTHPLSSALAAAAAEVEVEGDDDGMF